MDPFGNWVIAVDTCPLPLTSHPSDMHVDMHLFVISEGQRPSQFHQVIGGEKSCRGAHALGCPTNTAV